MVQRSRDVLLFRGPYLGQLTTTCNSSSKGDASVLLGHLNAHVHIYKCAHTQLKRGLLKHMGTNV